MKTIMKNAVDHLCNLLLLKATHPERFETQINFGARYTDNWDEPCEFPASSNGSA